MQLKINVIKAILTHNTEIGSLMDPFVVLKIGTQQKKSQTLEQAGDMPQFDFSETFAVQPSHKNLHLIVYDEDTTIDDLVGEVVINLEPILLQPFTEKKWYSLKYEGKKPAGKVMVEFTCIRNGKLQSPTKQEVKQIMRQKIHPIGVAPEHIGKGKLYGVETNNTLRTTATEYDLRLGQSHSQRSGGKMTVYSFRNNTVRNGNNNTWQSQQHGLAIGYTSRVLHNGTLSSNSSSGCLVPASNSDNVGNSGYYGLNSNLRNSHNYTPNNKNVYVTYQQPQYQNTPHNKNVYVTYQQPQYQNGVSNSIVYPSNNGWRSEVRIGSSSCLGNC